MLLQLLVFTKEMHRVQLINLWNSTKCNLNGDDESGCIVEDGENDSG